MKKYDIWMYAEGSKYERRRIPGMLVTNRGTLIIYNEARTTSGDWALMDIFCQRSTDNGETFGEPIYLACGTQEHPTMNNPVMMQDVNGRIHLLYCEDYSINGGRVLRRYSDDDGITWSAVIDMTESTLPEFRNVFALGPGHGICTTGGMLLVPVWMVPKSFESHLHAHAPSVISTFYSTDNGESWKVGQILTSNEVILSPNETEAVELSDGRIYLGIRHMAFHRAKAFSENGYSGWQDYKPEHALIDPRCFGSVAAYHTKEQPYTILHANCECQEKRRNVVLKGSTDDAKTWSLRCEIDTERGGYVETAVDNEKGLIYVLYEDLMGTSLHLAVVEYSELK